MTADPRFLNNHELTKTMVDDAEVLDWGGEDDEHYGGGVNRMAGTGDIDDVVSIGGEEDDMEELAAFQERALRDSGNEESPPAGTKKLPVVSEKTTTRRDSNDAQPPPRSPPSNTSSFEVPSLHRSTRRRSKSRSRTMKAPLTHALPPKPAVAPSPSNRNSGFSGARVMPDSKRNQESENDRKRTNGSSALSENLPADWEIRHSTSGEKGEIYYYNVRTLVSQWDRPSYNGKVSSTSPSELTRDDFPALLADNKLSRTQSASDMHLEKVSPSQDLSYDDRHYRPSNGTEATAPRPPQRERRDTLPTFTFRGGPVKELSDPQNKERQERDASRPYVQRSVGNESENRRNSSPGLSDIPPFSRNGMRDGDSGRIFQGGGGFDRGRARGLGSRRNIGTPQDIKPPQERFATDRMKNPYNDDQFKDPLPRPADESVPSSHRRHRSRSPSHLRRTASFRDGDETNRSYEEHNSERNSQSRLPSSSRFQPQHTPLQRQWNLPLPRRQDGAAPSSGFDPPARRPREYESSEASMGVDAKRRRVGSVTASPPFSRRGRSPSPMDTRDNTFRSDQNIVEGSHQTSRGKHNDESRPPGIAPSYKNSNRDEGSFPPRKGFGDTFGRPDSTSESRSSNNGPIPQGPRQRIDPFSTEVKTREASESGRRQMPSTYQQESEGQPRRSFGRPTIDRGSDIDRSQEAMDIDSPRPRVSGPPPNAGSMYSDRMRDPIERKETGDRLPTGPRAMHSKEPLPPSAPILPLISQTSVRTSPRSPVFDGRRSPPGQRGLRSSRFGSREGDFQSFTDRSESALDDRRIHASLSAPNDEPRRENEWRSPVPNGPRFLQEKPTFQRRPPSPKLSGTNNIPITPRKSWKVDNGPSDIPNAENERGRPIPNDLTRVHPGPDQAPPVGRGIHSPETRYRNLHGDVERHMSLSDRNNNDSENRFSSYDRLRETEQQSEKAHPLGSQNSGRSGPRIVSTAQISRKRSEADLQICQSRFSKPQDDAPITSETKRYEEPRLWIPRVESSGHEAPTSGANEEERRARSPPPRSADSGRIGSKMSPGDGYDRYERPQSLGDSTSVRGLPPHDVNVSHTMPPPPSPSAMRKSPPPRLPVEYRGRQANEHRAPSSNPNILASRQAHADRELRNRMDDRPIKQSEGHEALRTTSNDSGLHNDRPADRSHVPLSSPTIAKLPSPPGDLVAEEPRITTNPPFRIKRPFIKPGDMHQQSSRFDARQPEAFETNDRQERPGQLRSNSLLERLNMNADATASSVNKTVALPSLRDRVELTPMRDDGGVGRGFPDGRSGPLDGGYTSFTEGFRGRSFNRGRSRGGRGRRGRGRGGFNDS